MRVLRLVFAVMFAAQGWTGDFTFENSNFVPVVECKPSDKIPAFRFNRRIYKKVGRSKEQTFEFSGCGTTEVGFEKRRAPLKGDSEFGDLSRLRMKLIDDSEGYVFQALEIGYKGRTYLVRGGISEARVFGFDEKAGYVFGFTPTGPTDIRRLKLWRLNLKTGKIELLALIKQFVVSPDQNWLLLLTGECFTQFGRGSVDIQNVALLSLRDFKIRRISVGISMDYFVRWE